MQMALKAFLITLDAFSGSPVSRHGAVASGENFLFPDQWTNPTERRNGFLDVSNGLDSLEVIIKYYKAILQVGQRAIAMKWW